MWRGNFDGGYSGVGDENPEAAGSSTPVSIRACQNSGYNSGTVS